MTGLGRGTITAIALLLALPFTAQAAGGDRDLSLNEAVAKGMITNPEYAIVANDRRAVDNELDQARALYYPSIDFLGESGFEHTDTPTIDDESLWRNRGSLTLTQLLFDGWGTKYEIERQKARVRSTAHRVNETAEFVGLDVIEAFLEVLRQRDLLAIARANVQDHMRIMQIIEDGATAGTITEGDVAQAEARLAAARATEASTQEQLRVSEALFIQQVGDYPETLIFPTIPYDTMPESVDDAVRRALTHGPTLHIFEADVDVAEAEYHGTGSTLYPQVDLEVNGTIGNDVSGIDGSERRASVLGVVRWNLYRGGGDRARQREFIYRHALAKERRADAARQVEKDVRDTWAGVVSSSERAKQFLTQANANERTVNIYLDQYSLDRRTLLDVLDAQNELFVSRSNHVNALYTEMFGIYRLLALQGDLLNALNVEKPREASVELPG